MEKQPNGFFGENKTCVRKEAQIQTAIELDPIQPNLLKKEQAKVIQFRRASSQTLGPKISTNSRRSSHAALPSIRTPDFSNITQFIQINPSLFQGQKHSSSLKFKSCENVSAIISKLSVNSEDASIEPSRDHCNNICTIEKLRFTEFLQTSYDREWQEKVFAKLENFYPWKIQEPEHPSKTQIYPDSEKDLQTLQNLLTTFPFHIVYSTIEKPIALPSLSLSTFFDSFVSQRTFISTPFPPNHSSLFLISDVPEIYTHEIIPEESDGSLTDFEPDDEKDDCVRFVENDQKEEVRVEIEVNASDLIILQNTNHDQSKKRHRNFPSTALKSITNRSELSDIFKWRLINKHWNSICCLKLQKLIIPKITLNSEFQIETFLQVSQCPKLSLFNSFSLNQIIVRPPLISWKFFVRFGPICIKRLELGHDALIWVERFRELLQHLPNLESLSMGITRFRGTRLCPETPSEILGDIDLPIVKKLKHVNFYGVVGSFSIHELLQDFFSTFAPNVEIVQANPTDSTLVSKDFREKLICGSLSLRNLKKFDFPILAGELTLKKLAGCRLPLQELILIIKESVTRNEIILKLLKSVANTLKICEITFELFQEGRKQKFEIPGLKVLERLVLKNFYGGTDGLAFLYKCPSLKYMDLSMVDGYETMLPEKMLPMDSIDEVKLSPIAYCSSWAFQNILGMFPKLRKLTMEHAENFVLRAIFLEVETLEELSLRGSFTDEGITGIPKDKCKELLRFKMFNEVDALKIRESVSIGNLKNLRQLHLKSYFVTDVSIIHGVVGVKALTNLSIGAANITDVSLICVINKLQNLKRLQFLKCPSLSIDLQLTVWKQFRDEIIIDFEGIQHLLNAPNRQVRFSEDEVKDALDSEDADMVNC